MNRRFRDSRRFRNRDGRNPYGSAGGYVVSSKRDRSRGRNYDDYGMDYNIGSYRDMGEYNGRSYDSYDRERRNSEYDYDYERSGQYRGYGDGHYYPFEMRGRFMADDYSNGNEMSDSELREWHRELMHEIPEQYRELYTKNKIEDIAKQMNIEFREFSPMTLAVVTTMLASDYKNVIAPNEIQRYVALAKAWLCDEDSNLQYNERLATYYDEIING